MKKKLMITLEEDLFNWMEEQFINKSAFITALLRKKYTESSIKKVEEKEVLGKEEKDLFAE